MKKINSRLWLASLAYLGVGTLAFAQSAATLSPVTNSPMASSSVDAKLANAKPAVAVAFVDEHPYQSQVMLRNTAAAPGMEASGFLNLVPVTVENYKWGKDKAQTEPNAGLLYDRHNFFGPTTAIGNNYAFFGDHVATLSAQGSFTYYKDAVSFRPSVRGGVFFTDSGTNYLVMVDSYGYYWNSYKAAPAMKTIGGNYFIDATGVLTTFKSMGVTPGDATGMMTTYSSDAQFQNPTFNNIAIAGGNWFGLNDGTIVTVSAVTGGFNNTYHSSVTAKVAGGNWFIGNDNFLYTVDASGNIQSKWDTSKLQPDGKTPVQSMMPVTKTPTLKGYSFMKFADGTFIFVDGTGNPHTRVVHVNSTDTTSHPESQFPAQIDTTKLFMPSTL